MAHTEAPKGKQSVTIYKPERITEAKFIQQITQPTDTTDEILN